MSFFDGGIKLKTVLEITDNETGEVTYREVSKSPLSGAGGVITTAGLSSIVKRYADSGSGDPEPLYVRFGNGSWIEPPIYSDTGLVGPLSIDQQNAMIPVYNFSVIEDDSPIADRRAGFSGIASVQNDKVATDAYITEFMLSTNRFINGTAIAHFIVALEYPFIMPANSTVNMKFESYMYNCGDSPCAIGHGLTIGHGFIPLSESTANPADDSNAYGFCDLETRFSMEQNYTIYWPSFGDINPILLNNDHKISRLCALDKNAGFETISDKKGGFTYFDSISIAFDGGHSKNAEFVAIKLTFRDFSHPLASNILYVGSFVGRDADGPYDRDSGVARCWYEYNDIYYQYIKDNNNLTKDILVEVAPTGRLSSTALEVVTSEVFRDHEVYLTEDCFGFSKHEPQAGSITDNIYYGVTSDYPTIETAYTEKREGGISNMPKSIEKLYLSTRNGAKCIRVRTDRGVNGPSYMVLKAVKYLQSRETVEDAVEDAYAANINMTLNTSTGYYENDKDDLNQNIVNAYYDFAYGDSGKFNYISLIQPFELDGCSEMEVSTTTTGSGTYTGFSFANGYRVTYGNACVNAVVYPEKWDEISCKVLSISTDPTEDDAAIHFATGRILSYEGGFSDAYAITVGDKSVNVSAFSTQTNSTLYTSSNIPSDISDALAMKNMLENNLGSFLPISIQTRPNRGFCIGGPFSTSFVPGELYGFYRSKERFTALEPIAESFMPGGVIILLAVDADGNVTLGIDTTNNVPYEGMQLSLTVNGHTIILDYTDNVGALPAAFTAQDADMRQIFLDAAATNEFASEYKLELYNPE